MGRETLEPHELAEEALGSEEPRPLGTRVAVTAAVLAVLASISALQTEHTTAQAILHKNEAVLSQARASDEWAYRQAKSIKLHLQELKPGYSGENPKDRSDITASEERARADEEQREKANEEAAALFEQSHRFGMGTSLLQIAIVLETVAAVLNRRGVWWGGFAVGMTGALALANGFLGIV